MTTQTPATAEVEKWHRIRVQFFQIFSPCLDPGPKEKRKIPPESTLVLRIRSHLCFKYGGSKTRSKI